MRKLTIILALSPIFCFAQSITKVEMRNLIKEVIRIEKKKTFSYTDPVLIAENTDSIFFKSQKIKLYTSFKYRENYNFCRTLKLNFLSKKYLNLQDCQSCKEPTSCYVVTEKTYYQYKIIDDDNKIYLELRNKFETNKFEVQNVIRDLKNNIVEMELIRS